MVVSRMPSFNRTGFIISRHSHSWILTMRVTPHRVAGVVSAPHLPHHQPFEIRAFSKEQPPRNIDSTQEITSSSKCHKGRMLTPLALVSTLALQSQVIFSWQTAPADQPADNPIYIDGSRQSGPDSALHSIECFLAGGPRE
jgi:hypothetical protein